MKRTIDDIKTKPRFLDFARIADRMTPDQIAAFTMWLWINKQIPNPTIMDKWLQANQ